MKKQVWLEFPNDEKLNDFMRSIVPGWVDHYSTTGYSTIGSGFTKKQIEMAIQDFNARILEKQKEED